MEYSQENKLGEVLKNQLMVIKGASWQGDRVADTLAGTSVAASRLGRGAS
jgi:hypothetical protein